MFEFLRAGGPVMFFLVLTSIAGVTFIIERGLALRWKKVIPPAVEDAAERCSSNAEKGAAAVEQAARAHPSPMSSVLLLTGEQLDWPRQGNVNAVDTRARHEVMKLDRGLVILEIIVGTAPLTGLV